MGDTKIKKAIMMRLEGLSREYLQEIVEATDSVKELFGSWESDETAEELIDQVYSDRMDAPREVDL